VTISGDPLRKPVAQDGKDSRSGAEHEAKAEDSQHDEEEVAAVTAALTFRVSPRSYGLVPMPLQHLLGQVLDGSPVVGED
jgi:hypothetical protein